jgi:hypothetical protein
MHRALPVHGRIILLFIYVTAHINIEAFPIATRAKINNRANKVTRITPYERTETMHCIAVIPCSHG